MIKFIYAAALSALVSFSANAGFISFDFENVGSGNANSLTFVQDNITINISAFNADGSSARVNRNEDGLGVLGSDTSGAKARIANGDYLVFEILGPTGVRFTNFDVFFPTELRWGGNSLSRNDHVAISYNGITDNFTQIANGRVGSQSFNSTLVSGEQFIVASDGGNGIRVSSIAFEVPEPSSIAMLGLALVGLSLRSRKAK